MKTLISIDNRIWGKVKDYATVKELSLNSAVQQLLETALIELTDNSQQREREL